MTNIPTELLRTLIAVVDLRSFTRAAHSLGVTQPAVSAQIKRLQALLGGELFDKSAPGVTLTAKGEQIVNYARRMLALNDQMLDVTARGGSVARLRIGIAMDYFEEPVLQAIARFRQRHPAMNIQIISDHSASVLRDLRRGDYDIVMASTDAEHATGAYRSWLERCAWGAASPEIANGGGRLPLAVVGEISLTRRLSVAALEQAGIDYEIVYVGGSFAGMVRAVKAGLGVACWSRRLLIESGVTLVQSPRLPYVEDVTGGVYVGRGGLKPEFSELADDIADAVAPSIAVPERLSICGV